MSKVRVEMNTVLFDTIENVGEGVQLYFKVY